MSKSPKRKEIDKLKKRANFYFQFGGKDSSKDIHHQILLSLGGDNSNENLVYLNRGLHRLYHRLFNVKETDLIRFRGKNPSNEKVVDDLGKGCLDKFKKER